MTTAISLILALAPLFPEILKLIDQGKILAQANDITDAQLAALRSADHADVQALGDAIAAAKGN